MKLHRFIGHYDLAGQSLEITDAETLHQWRSVLRLTVGDLVILVDQNSGQEAKVEIRGFERDRAQLYIIETITNKSESPRKVVLYCAILKKENFELVAQKATECGVIEIVPLLTDRTVKQNIKFDRLEKIVREAVEQAGRAVVPIVKPPIGLEEAMELVVPTETYFFHVPDMADQKAFEAVGDRLNIFIGPEGGWSVEEINLAQKRGCHLVSLGPRVLRGETAAIVASYLACR